LLVIRMFLDLIYAQVEYFKILKRKVLMIKDITYVYVYVYIFNAWCRSNYRSI
jgi:hypothetical protein